MVLQKDAEDKLESESVCVRERENAIKIIEIITDRYMTANDHDE